MQRLTALGLLGLTLATPAGSGAWLRDEGAVFLSFGANVLLSEGTHVPVGRDPSLYLEWGYGPRTTLAFGIHTGGRGDSRTAEFRVIRPLPLPERLGVATVSGGLALREFDSVQYDADGAETSRQDHLASLGLAWGQGSDAGWITAEGRVMADPADGEIEAKLDLTGGYHITPAWSAMVQLQSGRGRSGDDYAKLLPSVIYRINDRLRINAGASHALTGDRGSGLFLAGWLEF
jgi:hypothetical protein